HCTRCLASIRKAVGRLPGVDEVSGDPDRQIITVTYRAGRVAPDGIREAIMAQGFLVQETARGGRDGRSEP
ncbi:MAG: copper chaperone, partial [Nitrospinota bacterium]